jgi:putative hydrolase of the HAD superfamily
LLDLDDTLYPQSQWLHGAWERVANVGGTLGVEPDFFRRTLEDVAAEGSDKGMIIDRALERVGAKEIPVRIFVDALRDFEPIELLPYPGIRRSLRSLASVVPIALVTDGDPTIQRSKLKALRLESAFDLVVLSDELGRSRRKPDPAPLIRASRILGIAPAACVYVGDRPTKDVAAARAARMRSIRTRTGEYRDLPDVPRPWMTVRSVPEAVERISPALPAVRAERHRR